MYSMPYVEIRFALLYWVMQPKINLANTPVITCSSIESPPSSFNSGAEVSSSITFL